MYVLDLGLQGLGRGLENLAVESNGVLERTQIMTTEKLVPKGACIQRKALAQEGGQKENSLVRTFRQIVRSPEKR